MLRALPQTASERNLANVARQKVLEFLNPKEVLCLSSTSKTWFCLAAEPKLWKMLNQRDHAGLLAGLLVQMRVRPEKFNRTVTMIPSGHVLQENVFRFLDPRSQISLSLASKKLCNIVTKPHVLRLDATDAHSARFDLHLMPWMIEKELKFGELLPPPAFHDVLQREVYKLQFAPILQRVAIGVIDLFVPLAKGFYLLTVAVPQSVQWRKQSRKMLHAQVSLNDISHFVLQAVLFEKFSNKLLGQPVKEQKGIQNIRLAKEFKKQLNQEQQPAPPTCQQRVKRVCNKKCPSLAQVGLFVTRPVFWMATEYKKFREFNNG